MSNFLHFSAAERWLPMIHSLLLALLFLIGMLVSTSEAKAACPVPNQISNGQVADATKVMGNFTALRDCVESAVTTSGTPVAGNLSVFTTPSTVSGGNLTGDCTTSGTVAVTCSKTNGVSFGALATSTDAQNLTGTIPTARFNNGTNADDTHFLRGDGVWAVPAGGSGGGGGGNWWSGYAPQATDFPTAFTGAGSNASFANDADIGAVLKANNAGTSSFVTRGWGKALPSGAWSVKARITVNTYRANFNGGGLYLFESGTNKFAANALMFDSAFYTDAFNGTLTSFGARGNRYLTYSSLWVRVDYDGTTNYTFYISYDGKNWLTTRVAAKSAMFTSAATHVGLGVTIQNNQTDSANEGVACDYWIQSW